MIKENVISPKKNSTSFIGRLVLLKLVLNYYILNFVDNIGGSEFVL